LLLAFAARTGVLVDEVLDHKQRRRFIVELFAPVCADIDTHPAAVWTETLGLGQLVMPLLTVYTGTRRC